MATYLGAFPFPSQAPCIVTKEALLKVTTIMTQRYVRVLKRGNRDRLRLFYGSLAIVDRRASESMSPQPKAEEFDQGDQGVEEARKGVSGFAIDEPSNDDADDEDDEDQLALAALDSLDSIEAISFGEKHNVRHSLIPTDNFRRLLELLLLIAPLSPQESLSSHASRLSDHNLAEIRRTAEHILSIFGIDNTPGISYYTFKTVVPSCLPHLFNGLNPLFEHFLFQKDFDLSRRKHSRASLSVSSATVAPPTIPEDEEATSEPFPMMQSPTTISPATKSLESQLPLAAVPLLPEDAGDLLTPTTLCQLSFFLTPSSLFHRMFFLYSGGSHGFSMGSFEKAVFTWQAPTVLLVSGSLLPAVPANSQERAFADSLPPPRFPSSVPASSENDNPQRQNRVLYGAYVPTPWKHTHKSPLSHQDAILFQLAPVHDVFRASHVSTNHLTFTQPPHATHPGIALGCPLTTQRAESAGPVPLGPVSLFLDDALGYGVFTHSSGGGGSFLPSAAPVRGKKPGSGEGDWQDRFEIEAVEVWGLGGEEQVKGRRRTLEFEEREARFRREGRSGSVSKGSGGVEADRELLKMAGLVGRFEGGGSV